MPSDWALPESWAVWAREQRPDIDVETVAEGFRDYWLSQPGAKGRKADWLATWRNWIRNQRRSPPTARPTQQPQRPLLGDDDHVFTGEGLRRGHA